MAPWFRAVSLVRNLLRRRRVERDLDDELRAWVELAEDERRREGLSAADARRAALVELGGADQVKEQVRDARAGALIEQLMRDLAYAARALRRHPVVAVSAVLSLALGIGASTAIFSLVDALLLKPLPVHRPDELRVVNGTIRIEDVVRKTTNQQPYAWYRDLRDTGAVFAEVLAFADLPSALVTRDGRELHAAGGGAFVSDNYFAMLGVTAHRGRVLAAGDGHPALAATPIVVEHGFWIRQFGADEGAIGREVRVNGMPAVVVGVARAGFHGLTIGRLPDLFLPIAAMGAAQPALARMADPANWQVHVVGRRRANVGDRAAEDELAALRRESPTPWTFHLASIDTGLSDVRERFVGPLSALLMMVAILLAIACVNVTTLLASRASARADEMAVRSALGASRSRLVRQLAAEALLLSAIAGGLGTLVASFAAGLIAANLPAGAAPVAIDVRLDGRILLFSIAIAAAAAVLAALVPALLALGVDPAATIGGRWRQTGESRAGERVSRPFVAAQVALALTLLVASGLLANTLAGLRNVDPGFAAGRLVAVTVDPGARQYPDARIGPYYRDVLDRIGRAPGVEAATLSQAPLLERFWTSGTVDVAGFTPMTDEDRWVQMFQTGPRVFWTLGMTIVAGRDLSPADVTGAARVAAINETAATRFFAGGQAIGRHIRTEQSDFEIVAVVRDARYNSLREAPRAAMFLPYTAARARPQMTFYARSATPEIIGPALRATVADLDPLVPMSIVAVSATLESGLGQERLLAAISAFFAACALVLLVIGLHGVMSFAVTARRHEIGVRLALGATPGQVALSTLGGPLGSVALGAALGVALTLSVARFAASFVFGLAPRDPATIAAALGVIAIVAATAAWLPARRAARVDPVVTLRCE